MLSCLPFAFRVIVVVFNATFNVISVRLWWSVLLVEETVLPGENHQHADKCDHIMLIEYTSPERDSNSQRWWWYTLIVSMVVNTTTIRSQLRCPSPQFYPYQTIITESWESKDVYLCSSSKFKEIMMTNWLVSIYFLVKQKFKNCDNDRFAFVHSIVGS